MKAVIYTKYGSPEVLKLKDIEKPKPKEHEILVKIHSATVTSGDVRLRSSDFPPLFWLPARLIFGLFKPKKKILGHEFAGVVEEVGNGVTDFTIGDTVFGTTTMLTTGSYAEYICVPQKWKNGVVGLKPENLTYQESAALPVGAMTALFLLEKANITKDQSVLIYGASGSVGSYAVQIATILGASVTGVCSTANFEMVQSLGAKNLIDYHIEDFSQRSEKFDIVFDAVGITTKGKAKRVLKAKGNFVTVNMLTKENVEHLKLIKEWSDKGKLKPFIDKTFQLDDIQKAHEYVEKGHKRGNVVIEVSK